MADARNYTQEYLDREAKVPYCCSCDARSGSWIILEDDQFLLIYPNYPTDAPYSEATPVDEYRVRVEIGICKCGEGLCQKCAINHRCGGV